MTDHDRNFYRVPCEFQIRFRPIGEDELKIFRSFAMRPSPHSSLKAEVDTQISAINIRDESKALFEKAFQILLNIDQRLERIEEQLIPGHAKVVENYDWIRGDLGAGGLAFRLETEKTPQLGAKLLMDMILPSMPEHRIVSAVEVSHIDSDGKVGMEFIAIHEDDREFLHHFVIARERRFSEIAPSSANSQKILKLRIKLR